MHINININKKQVIIALSILILIVAAVTGFILLRSADKKNEEPTLDEIVTAKQAAYETDLRDSLGSMTKNVDVAKYLLNWADNKEIEAISYADNNVVFSIPAVKEMKSEKPVVILCDYDANNMEDCVEPLSVALTAAKNVENNGPLKVIFLASDGGDKYGARSIDSKYFSDDTQVFYLGASGNSKVSTVTGGYTQYRITHSLSYKKPEFDKAYKITISGIPVSNVDSHINAIPNGIKTLGNLMANFKSTSFLFELASFGGGSAADMLPRKTSMVVVINESEQAKFTSKMDKAIQKFYDKYSDTFPEAEYTYKEVDLPSRVIERGDTDNIVSLMYTALNGVYYKDDDGNVNAVTNIGKISTKDDKLVINIGSFSSSNQLTSEISEAYETICGLCNVRYKITKQYDAYTGGLQAETLLEAFGTSFREYTGSSNMVEADTMELTGCSFITEKNKNVPILYFSVTENSKIKFAGSLITYMYNEIEENI